MRSGKRILALFLALSLLPAGLLTGCGAGRAATMRLVRAEGTVQVTDAKGGAVKIAENLGLYSGYGLATQAESYGWINMDGTKLAKLDADSEIEIQKSDGLLEVIVKSGGVFFNITEPLAENEAMNIRASSMLVGIRGTCGWVETDGENEMRVYLLRGKVECSVLDEAGNTLSRETITAGRSALLSKEGSVTAAPFGAGALPDFVRDELLADETLAEQAQEACGVDVRAPIPDNMPLPAHCYQISLASQTPHARIDYFYEEETGLIQCVSYDMPDSRNWEKRATWYMEVSYDAFGRIALQRNLSANGNPSTVLIQIEGDAGHSVYEQRNADGTVLQRFTIYYDEQGRMLRTEQEALNDTVLYDYDAGGRLLRRIQVTPQWSAVSQVYQYEGDVMTPATFVMPVGVTQPDYGDPLW